MTDAELDRCRQDGALLRSIVADRVKLKKEGRLWVGLCPFHAEKSESFTVYEDGHFHCFGCTAHGTVFDYVMKRDGVEFPEATKRVAAMIGATPSRAKREPAAGKGGNGNGTHKGEIWQPVLPAPDDAPPPTTQLRCDMLHEYRDVDGRVLCYVRRVEAKDGNRKQFWPLTFGVLDGKTGWHARAPNKPKPLYGLNRLANYPDAVVLLCEGEKSAGAAQRLFPDMVAMSWMGGVNGDGSADLAPLEGRNVILWGDGADEVGAKAVQRLLKRLPEAHWVDTADLPDGYDAADLERDGCADPEAWLVARERAPVRETKPEPEPEPEQKAKGEGGGQEEKLSDTETAGPERLDGEDGSPPEWDQDTGPDGETGEAEESAEAEANPATLPDLFVMKSDLPWVSQRLRDRLAKHPWMFERGKPVRLVTYPAEDTRPAEIPPFGVEAVIHVAHEVCRPYQIKDGKRIDSTLPDRVAKLYLALNGRWNLRLLHGICGSVLLDNDGGIHAHEGYHEPSGLWCTRAPPLNVPERPFKDQAVDALCRLRATTRTFTFKGSPLTMHDGNLVVDVSLKAELCESAALCALLTAVYRASLPLAPGIMINAPTMSGSGAGKGLLARMISAIAFGTMPKAGTAGHDEMELEKRIGSLLMRGDPVILLDNLNNMLLRSAQLESCLTEPLVTVRMFGKLEMQDIRTVALVILTGNGLQASTDTARRFIYPTIEPPLDNPGERQYPPGFLDGILARRPELLSDCLTIWRWGRQQPELKRGLPFGSYERWTEWVRDPLLALGCDDPVKGAQEARDHDPARVNLTAMFTEWRVWHDDTWVKADDLNFHVRRLIDDKERTAAIRQKLAPLVNTRLGGFVLESKVEGNAATRVTLYRVVVIQNG